MAIGLAETYSYRDAKGMTSWIKTYIQGSSVAAIATQALAQQVQISMCTNAAFQRASGPYSTEPLPPSYGSSSEYNSCEDRVRLTFLTSAGTPVVYEVPAPKSRIFFADQETFNPSDGNAANLVLAFTMHGNVTRDGLFTPTLVGGIRVKVPMHRRAGLYVKNPQLTTPGV